MGDIVHTLTNRRWSEKYIAYAESHDQALVGDKTVAFWLMDKGDADFLRYHGMQEFDRAMQHLEEKYGFMTSAHQYISQKDEGDKIIVFERGDLVFVFNFHWGNSYFDYRAGCFKPRKYKVVLNSDDKLFGGFGRIDPTAEYFTNEGMYDNRPRSFVVYAPSRTAVVYALTEDRFMSQAVV